METGFTSNDHESLTSQNTLGEVVQHFEASNPRDSEVFRRYAEVDDRITYLVSEGEQLLGQPGTQESSAQIDTSRSELTSLYSERFDLLGQLMDAYKNQVAAIDASVANPEDKIRALVVLNKEIEAFGYQVPVETEA